MSRQDAYIPIHKGMRSLIYEMSSSIQTADRSKAASVMKLVAGMHHGFDTLVQHGEAEEQFLFPRPAEHDALAVRVAIEHHREIHERINMLHQALHGVVEENDPICRVEMGVYLSRAVHSLLAFYLSHLCFEDGRLQPLAHNVLRDEDIEAIHRSVQRSLPVDHYAGFLRLMLRSMSKG